jgi:folate-dependent phosphoribosylglycinamide formyltransferase PurN
VEFVGQYGWLPLTPENVVNEYKGMIINQHPAPLDPGNPDFGGKGMYGKAAVYARLLFVKRTNRDFWNEAIAHRVEKEYDKGKVVKALRVPIESDDTVETLYARLYPFEYETQIQTLDDFANGKSYGSRSRRALDPFGRI